MIPRVCHTPCAVLAGLVHLVALPLVGQATPLTAAVDTLTIWLIRGRDTIPAGEIIDDLRITARDSGSQFIRVYSTRSRLLPSSVDTIVDWVDGLRPVRTVSVRGDSAYRLDFEPDRVQGDLVIGAGVRRGITLPLPDGTINAASLDLVLRSALLRIGDSVQVMAFTPTVYGGVARIAVRVDGQEEIGRRRAWRLVGIFPPGNRVTFWIDQDTRALLQQKLELPTGVTVLIDRRPVPRVRPQQRAA